VDERLSFITHKGQKILIVDFSHGEPKELLALLNAAQRTIALEPRNSLLTLADFTGAHINREVATRMKEVLTLDRPFVKRTALVGAKSVPKVYLENFKHFSQRDFGQFETREEALDWLVDNRSLKGSS
jgi:hypothetical protein